MKTFFIIAGVIILAVIMLVAFAAAEDFEEFADEDKDG